MNNEKIDEIGEKLNVNSSEIEPRKSHNWFKKHSFWMIHTTNFVLSSLIGLFFGLTLLKVPNVNIGDYPYIDPYKFKTGRGVLSINLVNGILTIPQKRYFNLGRIMRIGIVILNFIVSFAIAQYILDSIILTLPPAPYGMAILYNVYKSPTKINIQNKKLDTKN